MNYKKINENDITFLKSIVGEKKLFQKNEILKEMSHDELGTISSFPEVHVLCTTKTQVMQIMAYANQHIISVTVRGSGTGLVGGCVPIHGGILLDLTQMNQIIELDQTNMTLTVEPGVLLLDIAQHVEAQGLFYAPDPGEKTATIGGNISTNAGGMRAIKYGVTRDWVRGLKVVLPDGSLIETGGKVVKNSTGYALKDLIIGSEGTLGIIVEATLKLMNIPKKAISLLVPFQTKEAAILAAPQLINEHVTPTALEYLEKDTLMYGQTFLGKKIPHSTYEAYLLLSYDGANDASIAHDIDIASQLCVEKYGAIDVFLVDTDERRQSVWQVRGAFLEAIKSSTPLMDECDVVLPRSQIHTFLTFVKSISENLSLRIPYFGHVGDGNLHIYLCKDQYDDQIWEEKKHKAFDLLYDKAKSLGGLVSGEHGIGYAKKQYMIRQLGPHQMQLMKGIKSVFDPNHILNPGKVV